jgi:ribosomal protein S18 acetylase RimI-like enzyme
MSKAHVSAREAERHSLPLWPFVERVALGEWELRTDPAPAGRLIKRANSCLAMGDPGLPLAEAAARVRHFYEERDRPVMVQVERDSDAERWFAGRGWQVVAGGDTSFMLTSLADLSARVGHGSRVVVDEDGPRVRVALTVDGVEVASGRGAVDEEWLAFHGLAVDPAYRRRGHATELMAALVRWGAARGARVVWLHVETDNAPAMALYDTLGFEVHHRCRYVRSPDEST